MRLISARRHLGKVRNWSYLLRELTVNRYSAWFIGENGCDRYYKYNKGLLFRERQKGILEEMDEVRDLMEGRKE